MIVRAALAIVLLGSTHANAGSCVAGTATSTAKWVHDHDADLLPPKKKVRAALSDELFELLKREHACVERTQEVCAIDADLWTNTQDGGIFGQVTFSESENTGVSSAVLMKYKFALEDDGRDAKDWVTTVRLVRKSANACWTVDDIIGPDGLSLKATLRRNKEQP